jgi:hypothetical protein
VAVYSDHTIAITLGRSRDVIAKITFEDATEQLDVSARSHQYIDDANDRVRMADYLRRRTLGLKEIDGHVAEDGVGDELVLNIPKLRGCSSSTCFKDGIHSDKTPSVTAPAWISRLFVLA